LLFPLIQPPLVPPEGGDLPPLVLNGGDFTIMRQRRADDIWKNLYEFPLIETEQPITESTLCTLDFWKSLPFFQDETAISFQQTIRQQHKLTHRLLDITFTIASCEQLLPTNDFLLMTLSEAETKPKPIMLAKFLETLNF